MRPPYVGGLIVWWVRICVGAELNGGDDVSLETFIVHNCTKNSQAIDDLETSTNRRRDLEKQIQPQA
jgi:hypothetical protein